MEKMKAKVSEVEKDLIMLNKHLVTVPFGDEYITFALLQITDILEQIQEEIKELDVRTHDDQFE